MLHHSYVNFFLPSYSKPTQFMSTGCAEHILQTDADHIPVLALAVQNTYSKPTPIISQYDLWLCRTHTPNRRLSYPITSSGCAERILQTDTDHIPVLALAVQNTYSKPTPIISHYELWLCRTHTPNRRR